jgi:Flp pilus assembly protein TadG
MPRRGRRDTGLASSELAILVPALLFMLMLVVQFGLWSHAKQMAEAAAAEAVDAAQTPTGTAEDGRQAALTTLAAAGNLRSVEVEVDRTAELVTVTVRGAAPQLVPGFSWGVTARSAAPVERFIPEGER